MTPRPLISRPAGTGGLRDARVGSGLPGSALPCDCQTEFRSDCESGEPGISVSRFSVPRPLWGSGSVGGFSQNYPHIRLQF
jgi:hypothetical protein